ncbi:hypothetical protein PC116_g28175 [Phytophthora cactorum]|nr:hypothetical protein C6341_g26350 [Phytophthora cactorum]KAG4046079.1 hypothetical protein PC123_g18540 [Phytophthora cactorum]KAG4223358.1 hypothetical protein PC116_g28175 [Phytophthora cactorum]
MVAKINADVSSFEHLSSGTFPTRPGAQVSTSY